MSAQQSPTHMTWHETSGETIQDMRPLVSVLMIVYNHAPYLAEAIEGVLVQQCNFPFELIVGDDCSTDGSLQIALDYQSKNKGIIRVLHGGPNLGMNANSRRVRAAARGSFLAWCEGDDYWCDPGKLAAQAAILLTQETVGAVHTDWVKSKASDETWQVDWSKPVHRNVPVCMLEGDLLRSFHYPLILRTCTLMFRKSIADQIDKSFFGTKNYAFGDSVTTLFITLSWKVAYIPKVSAVYRLSPGSVLRSGMGARIRFLKSSLEFDADARAYLKDNPRYPNAYRWEILVGIMLWALRSGDHGSLKFSIKKMISDFSLSEFLKAALSTVWMRRRKIVTRRTVDFDAPSHK